MIFRQLDANSDWTFGKGKSNYAQGQQAIALNIATSVRSWVGDCFFSLPSGINWKALLNVGRQKDLDAALQNLLINCYGVMAVVSASVQFSSSSRTLAATYTVDTVYSQTIKNQIQVLSGTFGG